MIRQVVVVAPSGPTIVGRPFRRLCNSGRVKAESRRNVFSLQSVPHGRLFCTTQHACKNTDSRFFWPSRPDFLPTSSGKAKEVSNVRQRIKTNDSAQCIKRFLPLNSAKVTLPPPESINNFHAPLYTALAKMEVETAWSQFTLHLRDLTNGDATPIDAPLFDNLFWLLATENFTVKQRHEEVFGRLRIMLLYSSSQGDFGITKLQLHRILYVWITLWEQHAKEGPPFRRIDFFETAKSHLNQLHNRLANRVFTCVLNACTTAEEMEDILSSLQSWLGGENREKLFRQENWTSASSAADLDDNIYFDSSQPRYLDEGTSQEVLKKCLEIGVGKITKEAGALALSQPGMNTSFISVPLILEFFDSKDLFDLLPTEVKQGAIALENDYPLQGPGQKTLSLSQESKDRLVYPIAFILATRLHYSTALYLFERRNKSPIIFSHEMQRIKTFTELVKSCARLALANPTRYSRDSEWTLLQLQRSIRVFAGTKWYKNESKDLTCRILIFALRKVIVNDGNKSATQSNEQWLLLLRQFTSVLLTQDPRLDLLNVWQDGTDFYRLLQTHIYLEDFAFAKRLFLIQFKQEIQMKSSNLLMSRSDFLWMFQKSIDLDSDVRFANQLFLHWCSIGQVENEESYLHPIPSSLLRMYFWKLKDEKSGIKMLQQNLKAALEENKFGLTTPHQITRMMRTGFGPGVEFIDSSLQLAELLIHHWKANKSDATSTLIDLYSIAMDRSTNWIEESDSLLRSKVMAVFRDFQDYFSGLPQVKRHNLASKKELEILTIYGRALKTLIEEENSPRMSDESEKLITQLREWWNIEPNPNIWSKRIESYLVGNDKNVDQAKKLYNEALEYIGNDKQDQQTAIAWENQQNVYMETEEPVLSAPATSKLVMALAERGDCDDALQILSLYRLHAAPLNTTSQIMIDGAQVVILDMQGKTTEALRILVEIKRRGRFKTKARWLQLIQRTTRKLEQRLKKQNEHNEQDELLPAELSEEEKERAEMFAAMASGVPWRRKQ